jgi:[FeFe] hydrogenase H-cluster maturation GTPase HydF
MYQTMNDTPSASRLQIGIFGKRNAGKSSFINALTGQNLAIVSEIPGTTTDPVAKTMEIRGLGPVLVYDTAGMDDVGSLGEKRVARTREVMRKVDMALIITTYVTFNSTDIALADELKAAGRAVIVIFNKVDVEPRDEEMEKALISKGIKYFSVSSTTGVNIDAARQLIIDIGKDISPENSTILGDLIKQGDFVVFVVPIDLGAPRGRLILPQVQAIRDVLDNDAVSITVKERELQYLLKNIGQKPKLIVCDSQVVLKVSGDVPGDIVMTTFSILFSRLKGDLAEMVKGVKAIDNLKDGDRILILEACTHHAQADDIGRVKIPRWLRQYTGRNLEFDINAGPYVDKSIADYKLIISCGACMVNRREMMSRIADARNLGVPITNYGVAISYVQGVLARVVKPFKINL